ncbi:MAG: cupin domain-containing protein [Okeania sp. SIO2G4]|uniref:cupin domain-containing protein n=1 Tax=unclassified Okeania TaxID=2634635 RepID=UPI0013B8EA0A|nr:MULTISPECIES: cupin domain-containing protein [unclassified Okeania]NEP06884.1 cupin domain-containing protein [Okeania sp. SIO4D6]NEP40355.1 cupin domain-containing protein [Okeania sp. SIO2H7]NEP75126.1 cupin domain-containing protein [Okeania sp. SIO2G5]NEP94516.1 cupin domain-containing protein [Okeania sp. SIO2F5]NEQ92862.1 cupin domain-containing protein [Okeania sp. SIO2G4]
MKDLNIDFEKLKNEWENKGFKCETHETPPGDYWSSDGHESDEIFILLEGELEVSFEGKTYYPTLGQEFRVPANVPHTFKNPGTTANHLIWLYAYQWKDNVSGAKISAN